MNTGSLSDHQIPDQVSGEIAEECVGSFIAY